MPPESGTGPNDRSGLLMSVRNSQITAFTVVTFVLGGTMPAGRAAEIDFAHDVAPVLRKYCGQCHLGDKKQGGFSMNSREPLIAGGENGKAVVVGRSGASELIRRLTSNDPDVRMPPEGDRVPADKIALLRAWIDSGVKWEDGFTFNSAAYEPPLKPRHIELPPVVDGRANPVDRIIDAYFAQHKVARPNPVSDAVLVRRISLDVIGLLPEPEKLDEFLADQNPDKRGRLVRELLDDDVAYADHWLTFWNDLLRNDYTGTGFITGGRKQITTWLYRSLVENKPYDQFVRELIAPTAESEGYIQGIRWRGDVNSSQTVEVQFAQSISQSFLGINMKCASCHDSFIDRWKLDEAYGLAAIYASSPLEIHRCDKPVGRKATPSWIFPELGQIEANAPQPERLKQLAALMTHPDNGRFTRTIVNRLWHRLMGRGIVHPVDAMHTEPWSSDLLDYLAVDFAEHGYDLKHTIELICNSRAYQAQTLALDAPPDGASFVFRGPLARRMTAEQFMDSVWQITGSAPTKPDAQVLRMKSETSDGRETSDSRLQTSGKKVTAQVDAKDPNSNSSLKSEVSSLKTEVAPPAQWIWSYAEASAASPAGETIAVRRKFDLKAMPIRATAVITCDNEYSLFVNGRKMQSDANWETVEAVPLETVLKAGANEILIVAKNAGAGPNPAALIFEARLRLPDQTERAITTNAEWEWTKSLPDGNGRFKKQPDDWKPAVAVANPGIWSGRVGNDLVAMRMQAANTSPRMVRASLVKGDALMRSLGRPNRDQIVSMRPTDLTTLEAIDLANGQTLADDLAKGAQRLVAQHADSTPALVEGLFRFAYSRPPTTDELNVSRELFGDKPSEQSVQDLLWAIFMQPEFQLVR
jgi:Protein of unknown function (DUF1549)/Protein of unknown function (DUF1553)/Planctomycete cytochrome C